MSTAALSRNPSRIAPASHTGTELGTPFFNWLRRWTKLGKDRRTLQVLPDYVLADMGLERLEVRTSLDGDMDVWVTPRR